MTELNLSRTTVSDEGVKEIVKIKGLAVLDVCGSLVSDGGLKELAQLKGLTKLDVGDTNVTDAGVAEFKKLAPNCNIARTNLSRLYVPR